MPSISITNPAPNSLVESNFTASGPMSLDFRAEDPTAREGTAGSYEIKCWIEKAAYRKDSNPASSNGTSWQASFVGVLPGDGTYTLKAELIVGGVTYAATPVTGLGVVNTPIGGVGRSGGPTASKGEKKGKGDTPRPPKAERAEAAGGPPTAVPIHYEISGHIPDDVMRRVREISAAYFVDGVQLTRVFDAELNPLDGDYHLRMDLRRAAGAGKPGALVIRIEQWPNMVSQRSICNLIVVGND